MKHKNKNNKGFSLVEVVVAIAILTMAATAIMSGFVQAARVNQKAQRMKDAADLAQVVAEQFKGMSVADILSNYTASSDSGAGSLTGTRTIEWTGLTEQALLGSASKLGFTVDVTLNSSPYASNSQITTTYNQQTKLKQDLKDSSGNPIVDSSGNTLQSVVGNGFLVPVIKETADNCVISSNDYSDAAAIADAKDYYAKAYATAKSAPYATGASAAQYPIIYQNYYNTFATAYDAIFSGNRITMASYTDTTLKFTPKRQMTIKVKCSPTFGGVYKVVVLVDAKYSFASVTYDGVAIPAYDKVFHLISEGGGAEFIVSPSTGDGKKDIYFYYNASDIFHGFVNVNNIADGTMGASFDTVSVVYDYPGYADSLKKIGCNLYLIPQNFTSGSATYMPLFKNDSVSATVNSSWQDVCKVYSGMLKVDGGSSITYLGGTGVNGYTTDGGKNNITMYEMKISVKLDGVEYANFLTTKED